MENNNSFDWLAVSIQDSDKTFDDMYNLGISPEKVTLKDKDFYKQSDKVKSIFTDEKGKFDDKKFDAFYLDAQKSLNQYKKADLSLGNVTMDLWADTSISRAMGKNINRNPVNVKLTSKDPFTNLKNAQGSFLGITELNAWSDPTKTLAEVAQGQKVIDSATGKELNYTPEDNSIFNAFGFFSEPLVMAQYDQDVKDKSGQVIHRKGELKYDATGLPRYETLNGRNIAGRKQLSRFDTLTKEGTYANELDFMDSDGFDKSLTGLVVKSAVQLAPMLIGGPVSALYTGYYIASNLTDGLLELGKAIDGISSDGKNKNGSFYKFANNVQGIIGQGRSGMSEYGRSKMFSLESIASMAVDSVYQLKGQRAIAQWPYEFKKYQLAKDLGLKTQGLGVSDDVAKKLFEWETYAAKFGKSKEAALKGIQMMADSQAELQKVAKYASYMSTAYMAATSAKAISDAADVAGIDSKDKGLLYLGFSAALIPLFRSNYSRWVEKGIEIDHLASGINKATREYAGKTLYKAVAEATKQNAKKSLKERALSIMGVGKTIGNYIKNNYSTFEADTVLAGMAAEGFEEMTEEALKSSLQAVYNGFSYYGLTSSNNKTFEMTAGSVATDILAAGAGGAIGGAVFKAFDKNRPNIFTSDQMMEYVVNGYGDQVKQKIKDLQEKGQLGDNTLSVVPLKDENDQLVNGMYEPTTDTNKLSQNDFLADRLLKMVDVMEDLRFKYGIKDVNESAEAKNLFYDQLVDTKTDTSLRDDIFEASKKVFDISSEIQALSMTEEGSSEQLSVKSAELKEAESRLAYLQSDESIDEYFRQGLFNTQIDINTAFGVKTKDSFAKEVNPRAKDFKSLNSEEKAKVIEMYDEYKASPNEGLKDDLKKSRVEYETFDKNMTDQGHYDKLELYKLAMEELSKISILSKLPWTPDTPDVTEAEKIEYVLNKDFYLNLKNVKYLPDFMFNRIADQIKNGLNTSTDIYLANNFENPIEFKIKLGETFRNISLTHDVTNKLLSKAFGNKVLELGETEYFNDVVTNGGNAQSFNILKFVKNISNIYTETENTVKGNFYLDMLNSISESELEDRLINNLNPDDELFQYMDSIGLYDFIRDMDENSQLSFLEMTEDIPTRKFFNNIVKFAILKSDAGLNLSSDELFNELSVNNPIIDLMSTGRAGNLLAQVGNAFEIENLEIAKEAFDSFAADRANSPLREIMKPTFDFIESQLDQIQQNGISEYSNNSPDFLKFIDESMSLIVKTAALLKSAAHLNPLVNDFRKNHRDKLDTEVVQEEKFVLNDEDSNTLFSELDRAYADLKFIKDVNEYNRNNKLKQMLNEKIINIASNFKTISTIQDEEVLNLLPSLVPFKSDEVLLSFAENFNGLSEDVKKEVVYKMFTAETVLFDEFSKLKEEDKKIVLTKLLRPVYKKSIYEIVDGTNPLDDVSSNLYFASILGSNTLSFYRQYVGEFDSESQLFTLIETSDFIPIQSQENAIRLNYLNIKGDSLVYKALSNSYKIDPQESVVNLFKTEQDTISTKNLIINLGAPGTGKTTAVLTNTVKTIQYTDQQVLLLAPEKSQIDNLKTVFIKGELEDTINTNSDKFINFLNSLNLKIKDKDVTVVDYLSAKEINESIVNGENIETEFKNTIDDLFNKLDILKNGSLSNGTYTLREDLFDKLKELRLVVIDEFTHINPFHLAVLNKLINLFESSVNNKDNLKIKMILLGDTTQMGYTINDYRRDFNDMSLAVTTKPLEISLRSSWDLISNSTLDIRRRSIELSGIQYNTDITEDLVRGYLNKPINLNYVENYEYNDVDGNVLKGSLGIKQIKNVVNPSLSDLSFILNNKENMKDKDLVYITDEQNKTKIEGLMASAFGTDWKKIVDVYTPIEVQGKEYKYAIIDASANLKGGAFDIKRAYEFVNTMFSRSTEATLFINNEDLSKFITFNSELKEKAIRQIKINDQIKENIKSSGNALYKYVLKDVINITEPVEGKKEKAQAQPKEKEITTSNAILNKKRLQALFKGSLGSEKNDKSEEPGASVQANIAFNFVSDVNAISSLISKELKDNLTAEQLDEKIQTALHSYKYYLVNKEQLGDVNVSLSSNFEDLLNDYDYDEPELFIEATKRGNKYKSTGRSTVLSPTPEEESDVIIILNANLKHKTDGTKLTLALGTLSSISTLKKSKDANIKDLFTKVDTLLKGGNIDEVPYGNWNGNVWKSEFFNFKQLTDISQIFKAKVDYNNTEEKLFVDFQKMYPEMMITDPQVVVANIDKEAQNEILNPKGANTKYHDEYWSSLKGKSISFVSGIFELNQFNSTQLLTYYIKQIELYGPESQFLKLDKVAQQVYIDNVTDFITFRNGTKIKITPRLIQLIKLDNPKASFFDIRNRFQLELSENVNRDKSLDSSETLNELFKKFDMSIYVKDRLIKSLKVIQKFLVKPDAETSKWFNENIIKPANKVGTKFFDDYKEQLVDIYDESIINELDLWFDKDNKNNVSNLTLADFTNELSRLLDFKDSKVIRGVFKTVENSNTRTDERLNLENINPKDLDFTLSDDKNKDFSGFLYDVSGFHLFNSTKNINFAYIISKALEEFSKFGDTPETKRFSKYALNNIFVNGQIETTVYAGPFKGEAGYSENVLATAIQYGDGFTTKIEKIKSPVFDIDFNSLINLKSKEQEQELEEEKDAVQEALEDYITNNLEPITDTLVYSADISIPETVSTMEELQEFKQDIYDKLNTGNRVYSVMFNNLSLLNLNSTVFKTVIFGQNLDFVTTNIPLGDYIKTAVLNAGNEYKLELVNRTNDIVEFDAILVSPTELVTYRLTIKLSDFGTVQIDKRLIVNTGSEEGDNKNEMKTIKDVEKEEMQKIDAMITEQYSDTPNLKKLAGMFKDLYRQRVVTANMVAVNSNFNLAEYDAKLDAMDIAKLSEEFNQFIDLNFNEFYIDNSFDDKIEELGKKLLNYKSNIC